MNKTIQFDFEASQEETDLLKNILKCNDQQLGDELSKIAKASLSEYNKMILGQRVFTRGKDMQEFRLLNLIKYYFDGQIPGEQQICALFQVTPTEARGLIRAITAKYQYELSTIIFESLKRLLDDEALKNANADFKLPINNLFFKDELNKILGSISTKLPIVVKDSETNGIYTIQNSSYNELCNHFRIAPTIKDYNA
ncbi:hypothetical protein DBR11_01610 [Pedobacter sp. HMWF019]|uniref:hypothetical protein n=1 Tax=Pedobacter sp. HMWF019 TaxID=2056856 RepID=UPI000D386BD5|nr:hypothetical protein [Pedobacter sp. HMWF019]PTT03691.1 hypothetical protein DBR11_01610 [Pedobacter sp. HMWF019]